jgi:hypothetical protein
MLSPEAAAKEAADFRVRRYTSAPGMPRPHGIARRIGSM